MNLDNKTPAGDPVDDALDALDMDADNAATEDEDLRPEDTDDDEEEADETKDDASDEDEKDEEEDADAEEAKPKRSRAKKRIDQLTRTARDAERERDYYKNQLDEARKSGGQGRTPSQEEYRQGQQQGLSRQEIEAWVQQAATAQVREAEFDNVVSKVEDTLRKGGAEDALKRFSNPALTSFYPDAMHALHESKFPAQVAKAISGSEELFSQFSKASPAGQVAMIARVDGRLEARAAQKKSKTPPTTPQVRGKSRPPSKNPDDMDQAEYEAWTKKQGF